jgi:hypothetical protein
MLVANAAVADKAGPSLRAGGLEIFSAGQSIGVMLQWGNWGMAYGNSFGSNDGGTYTDTWAISSKGYFFGLNAEYGELAYVGDAVAFAGTGCTGEAYMFAPHNWLRAQGAVTKYGPWGSGMAYYIPRGATKQDRLIQSFNRRGTCYPSPGETLTQAVVVFPNDPAVTGVSNGPYALPIVFGVP